MTKLHITGEKSAGKNHYTHMQWFWAVNASAVAGWLIIAGPVIVMGTEMLILAAIIGLPIAFVISWAIVAPTLAYVMRNPISWVRAMLWGGVIAFMIALLGIAIDRYLGWKQSLNPDAWSQIGGGQFITEIDGILTPYGWWIRLQATAIFVCFGVAIAMLLRALIGPGRKI